MRRELKVCEGCGGLWIRESAAAGVYCRHCAPRMAGLRPRGGVWLPVVQAMAGEPAERCAPVFQKRAVPGAAEYRSYTEALLRRYAVMRLEYGRASSMLGRELFRGKLRAMRIRAFDDVVIFVHDVESAVGGLTAEQQRLLLLLDIQEYSFAEAACVLGISLRTTMRRFYAAVDQLTGVLLERGLLKQLTWLPA